MASTEADKEIIWMKEFISELGIRQEEFRLYCDNHVDEAKVEVIQKVINLTNLKPLKAFAQKVCSLERFIHMLTCLLLSRTMYHMTLDKNRKEENGQRNGWRSSN